MRILVLGGGMQGRAIAANLAARREVDEALVGDVRAPEALPEKVRHVRVDALRAPEVREAAREADAVVVALPGTIGKMGLAHALPAGKPVVDISFTPETLADLADDARRSGACAVVDCGVAPGLSHVLAGLAHKELDGLDRLRIRVGGIPLAPPPVFGHAVYFNAMDLLSEYVRPARLRRDGRFEAPHPLLAPIERYDDPEMGEHEAFVSDGLRSLVTSYPDVRDMVEWTLRRPGHLDVIRALGELGLLDTHPLEPDTEPPVMALARTLAHRYPESRFPDYLLMTVEGEHGGARRAWRLLDRARGGLSAMSRTTAFTAAAVAMQLAQGRFAEPGLHAPERLGEEPAVARAILDDLRAHGVEVQPMT